VQVVVSVSPGLMVAGVGYEIWVLKSNGLSMSVSVLPGGSFVEPTLGMRRRERLTDERVDRARRSESGTAEGRF
jgi:hypothetical protein